MQPHELVPQPSLNGQPETGYWGETKVSSYDGGFMPVVTPPKPTFWCSLPSDTAERRERILDALAGECLEMADHIGTIIGLESVLIKPFQREDEDTGEMVTIVRIVLMCAGGENYVTTSQGVRDSIGQFIALFGNGPWNPPIQCEMVKLKLSSGFPYFTLKYLKDRAGKPGGDKKKKE